MSLTAPDMTQVASDLLTAFNDADWDRVRTRIAPELSYVENTSRRRADGADAYLELLKAIRAAFPDFTATIEATAINDDTVVQRVLWEGTHSGVLDTLSGPAHPSGDRVSVVGSVWSRFEGDTIREIHSHIDALSLREQIGAMPG